MRLGSVTLSATLSTVLLSGCSFIGGQPSGYQNPYAKKNVAHHGQYGPQMGAQNCQIATPRQPIPRGCRPEQVTIGTAGYGQQQGAYGAPGGFPQQPNFGQPQYTDGGYGNAVGQTPAMAYHRSGPKKRKPRLRGSLSTSLDKNTSGDVINLGKRDSADINSLAGYNPQDWVAGRSEESDSGGTITSFYTANEQFAADIFNPFTYESDARPNVKFDDVWSAPISVKAGLEYILKDNTTVFANGGYTQADGNEGNFGTVTATIYEATEITDEDGNVAGGGIAYVPNVDIATFSYDFSELKQYDIEVGARRYFKPLVQSEGFRTVTPFVGASVGVSHVNATDVTFGQRQAAYDTTYDNLTVEDGSGEVNYFDVPAGNTGASPLLGTTTRLYDSQWLPQGQLNVGAEWQVTPGFALAAETGLRFQGAREYADFTDTNGDLIEGRNGDVNISVPVTLRGSINF